jgi:hypothetical protein
MGYISCWSMLIMGNIKKNIKTLIDDSKEVGLEVNTETLSIM